MKFWKSVIGVFIVIVFSCGTQKTGGNFLKDGVSFKYPSGWSIDEEGDLDGSGYFLSVNKSGYDASGLFTVTWIEGILDSHEYLEIIQENYGDQKVFDDLEFKAASDNDFNGIPTISCDYKFNTIGIKHRGVIHVFSKGERTYSIVEQETIEDISKNKEGFDMMKSTFKVE